jgi:hypothetical protein
MTPIRHLRRRGLLLATSALALVACRNALDVTNPKYIDESQLNNPTLSTVLLNTAVGAVNTNYSEFGWFSAIMTDEALNATNDFHSGELNQRIVELAQGNVGPYPLLQFSRATADSAAGRLRAREFQVRLRIGRERAFLRGLCLRAAGRGRVRGPDQRRSDGE